MTYWAFVLTPLLVLLIVLLFRFVGCGDVLPADPGKPRYRDYIMAVTPNPGQVKNSNVTPRRENVIAYWRLVDQAGAVSAKDETGFQPGQYKEGLAIPGTAGSESAPGNFKSEKGLIASDPATCRFFNGAYVLVPYKEVGNKTLYTDEFTIEAWIDVRWGQNIVDVEHMLFSAGGFYDMPFDSTGTKAYHGFRVFANGENCWQMQIAPSLADVFDPAPEIPRNGRTHLAVTVQKEGSAGQKRRVIIYVDAKTAGISTVDFYYRPDHAPLLIGVDSRSNDPLNDPPPTKPILSLVQEVVLHNKALSQEEIENHVDINKVEINK